MGSGLVGAAAYLNIAYPAEKIDDQTHQSRDRPLRRKSGRRSSITTRMMSRRRGEWCWRCTRSLTSIGRCTGARLPAVAAAAEWRGFLMDRYNLDRLTAALD